MDTKEVHILHDPPQRTVVAEEVSNLVKCSCCGLIRAAVFAFRWPSLPK